jgi:hypothetical protein
MDHGEAKNTIVTIIGCFRSFFEILKSQILFQPSVCRQVHRTTLKTLATTIDLLTMAARGMSGGMQGPAPGMGPIMVLSKLI